MDGYVDHYAILGLPRGEEGAKISEEEIKKAYRSKLLEVHPDKRPNDPNAHHDVHNLLTSYKILMDKKARQSFHQAKKKHEEKMIDLRMRRKSQQQNSSSKRRRKTEVDEREQAARAAFSAAKAAHDMEECIRRRDEQLIARIKRDAAATTSKAPPAAATLNKGGAKEALASTRCPCGHCQDGHWLDREFSCNFDAGGFEAHENSLLTKFRTERHK